MAFGPITSWKIDGEPVETVSDFIFRGSKITADGDCNHEIKKCLLLGRKVMTNLAYSKAETSLCRQKVCIIKAMVFPVVRYGCESGTIRNAEHQRIDALLLRCWSRFLDYKKIEPVNPKGNQPWILIGRTDAEVEAPVLWPPDVKSWLIGKDADAGKD